MADANCRTGEKQRQWWRPQPRVQPGRANYAVYGKKKKQKGSQHILRAYNWFVFWGDLFSSELYRYLGRFLFSFCRWKTEDGVEGKCPAKIAERKSESRKVKPGFLIPRPLLAFHQLHTLKVKPRASLPTHKPLITYFKSALSRVPVPQPINNGYIL